MTARHSLVRLRARPDTLYLSHGRTVLATDRNGFIEEASTHGLFAHETRLLSRYRLLIDGTALQPNALSNVEQCSWLGYYLLAAPGLPAARPDEGSGQLRDASQQALEIRISRVVGDGLHEDIDVTNFSQYPTAFELEIELSADFADLAETAGRRRQIGTLHRSWRALSESAWQLEFTYHVDRNYSTLNVLLVDPQLPDWLPQITLRDLRVGESRASIRFFRTRHGTSSYRVLDSQGPLHVVHQPSPWSLTASFGERIRDLVGSLTR